MGVFSARAPLFAAAVLPLALLAACAGEPARPWLMPAPPAGKTDVTTAALPRRVPKRVILFIGDGMGIASISAGAYARGAPLHMMGMTELGFMETHEHEFITTDSAAAATAIASGSKSHFGAIGVKPGTTREDEGHDEQHLETLVEVAEAMGWRTGLVATTAVTDATPAAFAAHRASRKSKAEIALDLSSSSLDLMLGGGSKYFERRSDGRDLFDEMEAGGATIARTRGEVEAARGHATRLVGLMHPDYMPGLHEGQRAMSLSEMLEAALEVLDRDNDQGFFLMVEGSQIDLRGHELDGAHNSDEVLDMDDAVGVALAYARGRDDALVVVTADHETGGLAVMDPLDAAPRIAALGGPEAATAAAAFRSSDEGPPPFAHVGLGGDDARSFGPATVADASFVASYAFMSVESRRYWGGPPAIFRGAHSPTMVALFAEGVGANLVATARDNADLGALLKRYVAANGVGGEAEDDDVDAGDEGAPRNVIVVVAEGMGLSAWTSAHYVHGPVAALEAPHLGLTSSFVADRLVGDGAALATALAAGVTTRNGAVGVDASGRSVETLIEEAERAGRRTGIVSTGSLGDGTLAAFYAHRADARDVRATARAIVKLGDVAGAGEGVDVYIGGGSDDLTTYMQRQWRDRGVDLSRGFSALGDVGARPAVRLVAPSALAPASQRGGGGSSEPTLTAMTESAIDALDATGDGFVLVVHAAGVARALSSMSTDQGLVDEVIELDETIAMLLAFAAGRDDTTVVVTGLRDSTLSLLDNHYGFHERHCGAVRACGGPEDMITLPIAIDRVWRGAGLTEAGLQGDFSALGVHLQYAWLPTRASRAADGAASLGGPGSAHLVPLFAAGPGTAALEGYHTLAEVGAHLRALIAR